MDNKYLYDLVSMASVGFVIGIPLLKGVEEFRKIYKEKKKYESRLINHILQECYPEIKRLAIFELARDKKIPYLPLFFHYEMPYSENYLTPILNLSRRKSKKLDELVKEKINGIKLEAERVWEQEEDKSIARRMSMIKRKRKIGPIKIKDYEVLD